MAILNDIRNQPPHIREIFMWLCVVITFSVVSFFWIKAESRDVVALLNPQEQTGPTFAEKSENQNSLFANIGDYTGNMKESLFELLGIGDKSETPTYSGDTNQPEQKTEPKLFPTSPNK